MKHIKNLNTISDYYVGEFRSATICWFDNVSGEGFVKMSDGPLKDKIVFVHGSAFGGDYNFGQNRSFEVNSGDSVQVILYVDSHFIQVSKLIKSN